MSDLTDVKFFLASLLRPIVREAIREELSSIGQTVVPAQLTPANSAPILSGKQVKEMTGWADGTFYAKVAKMPEGVVIRKSKRLLFDREKFMQWLHTPAQP